MDAHDLKRVCSFLCWHINRGETKKECIQAGLDRDPPHSAEDMEAAWPHAKAACDAAARLQISPKTTRLCDVCKGVE